MTQAASQCPPADVIAAFAFGELRAANADSVRIHVSQCESCLQTVGALAGADGTLCEWLATLPGGSATPAGSAASALSQPTLAEPGQLIGPYRLVRYLGEGGMGEVWEAEQLSPVRRTVALKLLKAGMDTRKIVARFAGERQVLALMQHPGIAQVFDAGITAVGRPYFVMEYVGGVCITRYCDEAKLNVRERLLIFQEVCDAVQHAHQKGVIHRDIKPSNVLVTLRNGRPQPKVIDFGLAKLTAPDVQDATLTEVGTVLGTPAYASPEQMTLGVLDVDTRSDVYSLGVLLYELLIGAIPFEPQNVQPGALLQLQMRIREHEPTRPSARLSALGERASELAKLRGTDAGALRRQLRGELDWIVMRALENDRSRRYASPGDLARDTQRYLDHEPVLAAPPTATYRLRKFVRRHYVGAAFAAVLFCLIVAFAAVSAIQVKRIAVERDRAASEAAKASSINKFLQDTLGSADPWQTGSDISVRETLKRAAQKVDSSFRDQPLVAAAVHHTLGKTYTGLGRFDEAEHEIRAALTTRIASLGHEHAEVAESLEDLAFLYRSRADYELADQAGREALDMQRRLLGNQHPLVAETLFERAVLLKAKGQFDEAERAATEALAIREQVYGTNSDQVAETMQWLGLVVAAGKGELVRGEQLVRRGYEIHRQLFGVDDVRTVLAESNMGSVSLYAGKYAQAEAFYRTAMLAEVRLLGKNHPDTITETENVANTLMRLKRFDEAAPLLQEVLAGRRAGLGDDNRLVARTMINIARLLSASGRLMEAQATFEEALPKFTRAYGPEHPDTALSISAYGVLRFKQHEYGDAERLLRQALAIYLKQFPDDHPKVADTRLRLGETLTELHQFAEAEHLLVRAQEALLKAYGADSMDTHAAGTALERLRGLRGS